MSRFVSVSNRRFLAWAGLLLCLVCISPGARAQENIDLAPLIISQPDSTRALAVSPRKKGAPLAQNIFAPGGRTRITIYVTNVELMKDEGATAFRADIQDSRYRYPLTILSLEPASQEGIYALTFRLHEAIGNVGDVLLRVTWRGMSSNRVRLSIGHSGGKIEDDPGAVPTPWNSKQTGAQGQSAFVGLPWSGDRVRFMEQATFGPKADLESRLRRLGYSTWIAEQMATKFDTTTGAEKFSWSPYPNLPLVADNPPSNCGPGTACNRDNYTMYPLQNWFFRETLYGDDYQLRRRISWALSQIWVVSGRETVHSSRMLQYIKVLDKHVFGNYRNLMADMTLNPAMGNYLDMAISTRNSPNENYAREILQLFSVGLFMLNPDGTLKLDAQGNPIPTYDQSIVDGFTKVFTGWTFCSTPSAACPNTQPGVRNFIDPMVVNPANHDNTAKQVLNYPGAISAIPAGLTPEQDLDLALDNIFYHPNVGPFIGKLLIQQLVTSNPTPAYVGRVAAKFDDNGQGIRGDMKAVVRAILLDPEARGNLKTDPDYGHLKEPVIFLTSLLRPFNPTSVSGCSGLSDGVLNAVTLPLDQDVFNPPSVFNYYPMDYVLPNTTLNAPEFGIFSTGTALKRPNFVNDFVFGVGVAVNGTQNIPCGTRIDLSRLQTISSADTTGALLVDTLNREMMHSSMSAAVRGHILLAVQAVSSADHLKRTRTALYLVATSSQYQVQR